MRRVAASGVAVGSMLCAAVVSDVSAGDPKAPAARPGPTSSATLPARFVLPQSKVKDLKVGGSARVARLSVRIAADGSGWLNPEARLLTTEDTGGVLTPTIRRVGDATYDVDLTACDSLWALTNYDGTAFAPESTFLRIHQFQCAGEAPSDVLPERFRGSLLWSLPAGQVAYIGARRIAVDYRGEAWVHASWPVRLERFVDSTGPAVTVTASERDVVKLDVTGVTYRWEASYQVDVEDLKGDDGLNGHFKTPFGVTSVARDGRSSTKMPDELLLPQLKYLKPGAQGFIEASYVRMDPNAGAWIDPDAAVRPAQTDDDWGFKTVGVRRIDAASCSVDLGGTTYRWCVASHAGWRFPAVLENGNLAFGQTWLKVADIVDGGQSVGAALPRKHWAVRIWEGAPAEVVYTSCRFLAVDEKFHGFVAGWIPVVRAPFSDELGPAASITLGADDQSCVVDLAGVTHQWEVVKTPEFGPVEKPLAGGPRVTNIKVSKFVSTEPAPAAPPSPPAKPPTKKK